MKRTIFLSFALSCAAVAQQPSTSTPSPAQVENAIRRLPAGYRNAANKFLHLESENLAHIANENDQKWTDEAIATILRNPDGRSFLIDQLEKEPDGHLRASILITAQKNERLATESPKYALTAAELEIVRRHASGDPDPKAAAAALNIIYLADRMDEQSLLEARRNLGDSSELRDLEWTHFTKYGEIIRNPLFNYNPPPLFSVVPGNQSVRVLAFGDFGTGEAGQVQDAHAMHAYHKEHPFDFGLTLGDNFYSAGLNSPDNPRWQTQWEQLYGPLGIKFYPVYGNHDYDDPDSPAAELAYSRKSQSWVFPAPYYTFTAGAAQFFAIDNIRLTDSELAWLDEALSKSTAKWKIVYGHYHMYSATRGDDNDLIKRLLPILEKNHVQIYLNGHDHNMQEARTESPVHFFTSGAGGAGCTTCNRPTRDPSSKTSNSVSRCLRSTRNMLTSPLLIWMAKRSTDRISPTKPMDRREFFYGAIAAAVSSVHRSRPPDVQLEIDSVLHEVASEFVYRTTAYNGQVPAPVLRLRQGVPVTIEIANHTLLDEYVHWHGLDVPASIDGTMEENSIDVPARSRIHYTLTPHQPGVRWIHSHAMSHGQLDRGVYSGQYGIVYVEPRDNPGAYDREFFLAAHEWGAEMRWIQQSEEEAEDEADAVGLPASGSWEVQYDIGSINGKALGAGEPLRVREGERVLFHILNASATVTQTFALPGHRFEVAALDGNAVPQCREVEVLELGAGERISAFVRMTNPGVWILGAVRGSDREDGRMGIVVEYAGSSGVPRWEDPSLQRWDYTIFAEQSAQPELASEQLIPMVIDRGARGQDGMETWTINGKPYDGIPERLRAGLRYRLLFDNRSDEDHPVHLHRHSFELTRVRGRAIAGIWKDVAMLKRYARLEIDFTPASKGLTLFHCHQQMHMDRGFKKLFEVV